MSVSKQNTNSVTKEKREAEYQRWLNEKRNEKLCSFFSSYSKFSILIFFALLLLVRWFPLSDFYIIFPIFFGLHLLLVFLFPSCFSVFPAYGKTKDEKEGFSACTFLLGPSVFSLFYFYRYSTAGVWLSALLVSVLLFALLLLRYRREVLARISGTVVLEFFLFILAFGGALLMVGFLTAFGNRISVEEVTVVEKSDQTDEYILTVAFENGEEKAYYVTESVYNSAEKGNILCFETYEGLFSVQTTQLTSEKTDSP